MSILPYLNFLYDSCRMNNGQSPPANQRGILNKVANLFKSKNNANNASKKPVLPVTAMGGAAPVNFRYPENMQQPSEDVMKWATTAGMPRPTNMAGVAHGGKRRTHRRKGGKRRTHHRRSAHIRSRRHTKRNRRAHNKRK
jgi:putative hemolysin